MTVEPRTYGKADDFGVLRVAAMYYEYPQFVALRDVSVVPGGGFTSMHAVFEGFRFCVEHKNPERYRALAAATKGSFQSMYPTLEHVFFRMERRFDGIEGDLGLVLNSHGITTISGKAPGYLLPSPDDVKKFVRELYGALVPFAGGFDVPLIGDS